MGSTKQNLAFTEILYYFKTSQTFDETNTVEFEELCKKTVDKPLLETGTTIDPAWKNLRTYVMNQSIDEHAAFEKRRIDVCAPLYAKCSEVEQLLKVLFREANVVEHRA